MELPVKRLGYVEVLLTLRTRLSVPFIEPTDAMQDLHRQDH